MVTVYHATKNLFTAHHTDIVRVVQSTDIVQPQAYPMMLLVFAYHTVHYTLTARIIHTKENSA